LGLRILGLRILGLRIRSRRTLNRRERTWSELSGLPLACRFKLLSLQVRHRAGIGG
jgi:hypothetical protein